MTTYYIDRNGQQFGPYSFEQTRNLLTQGSFSPSDLVRDSHSPHWIPLHSLLEASRVPPPHMQRPFPASVVAPPSLHWLIVFAITFFTGIFSTIWLFVQSSWIKKIDPGSRATLYYALSFASFLVAVVMFWPFIFAAIAATNNTTGAEGASVLFFMMAVGGWIAGFVLFLAAVFSIKGSMERYYTLVEPIGLRLSGAMLFFFNVFYIQYHFSRIAEWKRTGILQG